MKYLKRILIGLIPLALLVYPILVGLLAYAVFRVFRIRASVELATGLGYLSLIGLPCYILGNAVEAIWDSTKHRKIEVPPRGSLDCNSAIEIWKKCLDVQMHFNDIELQIRNYAVTLLVAVTGAAAYAFKEHLDIEIAGHGISLAIAILPAGILGWSAFYFMDRLWYHKLLLGAVYQTLGVEKLLSPELDLSHAIGVESPIVVGSKKIHSTEKIDLFYTAGLTFLILFTGLVLWQARSPVSRTSDSGAPPKQQVRTPQ